MESKEGIWTPAQADPEFYKRLLDSLNDAVYFVDRERRIVYWNKGAERITGFSSDDVLGHLCYDNLLSHVDGKGQELCRGHCPLSATMADGEAREAQVFLRHKSWAPGPDPCARESVAEPEGRHSRGG
jgi:PAS domain-containing protein